MIELRNIRKAYGKKIVLKQIDLTLSPGEQAAIIGGNGCGKSTLLHIMAGISKPDDGHISYFGHDIMKEKGAVQRYCGYLPQEDPLMEELSVQDNISLWSGKGGRPDGQLIDFLGLGEILRMPVYKLSGGMRRRVSIACAIALWPPILLMDEPGNGLDVHFKQEVRDFMERFRGSGGTLVVATHDEREILASSRIFEIQEGCLLERGRDELSL